MYIIKVNDDNTLSAPKKQRIIQRSKLVDDFYFLVPPFYNEHDMSTTTVLLEYLQPVSKKYKTEILVLSEDRYEEYLKYVLPVDTEFTKESGSLELQLSFIYVDIDADGNDVQRVRKTAPVLKVEIVPISAWSDIIPDEALNAIDQKLIKVDAQIKALNDINETLNDGSPTVDFDDTNKDDNGSSNNGSSNNNSSNNGSSEDDNYGDVIEF